MLKILFGVYADEINAQNINCVEIAKRLNKDLFDVHIFCYQNTSSVEKIKFHKTTNNKIIRSLIKILNALFGSYDIIYVPRVEKADKLIAKILKRRRIVISSVEIEEALHNEKLKTFFCEDIYDFFTINEELKNNIQKNWGLRVPVLPLGFCRTDVPVHFSDHLQKICFVGSLINRKRPDLFVKLAEHFRYLSFIIIGDGLLRPDLEKMACEKELSNIQFMGAIPNNKVYEILADCDLLCITSENEGQPKVSLEAASLGVPTCYIENGYKIDFIANGETGFSVKSFDEMRKIINDLYKKPSVLCSTSKKVYSATLRYDWDNLIAMYEQYFIEIANNSMRKEQCP